MITHLLSARRRLIHRSSVRKSCRNCYCLLFVLLLSPRKAFASPASFAPTCAAKQIPAYAHKGSNDPVTPLMRAWMCHGKSHREMVDKLASAGIVKSPINKRALLAVDRGNFAPKPNSAYEDAPQPIGHSQTISAPHMHAYVLEDLLPPLLRASRERPDGRLSVLDVGCGSGYLTAVFGRMVGPRATRGTPPSPTELNDGKVYGIDVVPQLVDMSRRNIRKGDGELMDSGTVTVMLRDGWKGYPDGAPFDAIHVGAAAAAFPEELMKQLAVGGVMVIPVGPEGGTQYLYRVERVGGKGEVVGAAGDDRAGKGFMEEDYRVRRVLGVRYVPLVRTGE